MSIDAPSSTPVIPWDEVRVRASRRDEASPMM
jgi:hypothetical protein